MLLDFTALKAWGIIIWNGNTFFNQIFKIIIGLNILFILLVYNQ